MTHRTCLSRVIKEKALELGFDLCGITASKVLPENGKVLKQWCEAGMNDRMGYLGRNIEKRSNPGLLFPGARSLVVTGMSYYSENKQKKPGVPIISRYAYGTNYHEVITARLDKLLAFIKSLDRNTDGKSFVDSAPLLEKPWTQQAGLGWQGKHSVVINKKIGSFFFIGILVLNIDLIYDKPSGTDLCGTCKLCIDACPTGAVNDNRTIDARKCIAHMTIENRDPVPEEFAAKMGRRVYGCDRCQEVCPWNKIASPNNHPEFQIPDEVAEMSADDWKKLTKEQFDRLFKKSSMGRVKYKNLIQNIRLVMKD